jgi:hypothetical protein
MKRESLFPLSRQPLRSWLETFNQYSADQHLLQLLRISDMLTNDPHDARLFIIPQFATHETHFCAFNLNDPSVGTELGSCANYVCGHYLQHIRDAVSASPWFMRHGGADHLLIFPWDLGHLLFRGTYSNNSLRILPVRPSCNIVDWVRQSRVLLAQYLYTPPDALANRTVIMPVPQSSAQEPGAVMRNVLMQGQPQGAASPGSPPPADTNERIGPPNGGCAVAPTRWLATFRGTVWDSREYSGGIRQDLLAYYAEANRSAVDGILFSKGHTSPEEYAAELRDSLFCLSPPGSSAWSQRVYSLVAAGCPLVFFDSAEKGPPALAFPRSISWADFSITIPVGEHLNVARILAAVPVERVCAMRRAVTAAAQFLLWNTAPENVLALVMAEALAASQALIAEER